MESERISDALKHQIVRMIYGGTPPYKDVIGRAMYNAIKEFLIILMMQPLLRHLIKIIARFQQLLSQLLCQAMEKNKHIDKYF